MFDSRNFSLALLFLILFKEYHGSNELVFKYNSLVLILYSVLKIPPYIFLSTYSHGYPCIHFCLLFIPKTNQTPVSHKAIRFSDVMVMAWTIPAKVVFLLPPSVAKTKEYMEHMLSLPKYCFVEH